MVDPDTKFAKIIFYAFITLAVIGPLILYNIHKNISSRCSTTKIVQKEKKKKNNTIRNIIIISILAGLTAQAMNYSSSYFRIRPLTK